MINKKNILKFTENELDSKFLQLLNNKTKVVQPNSFLHEKCLSFDDHSSISSNSNENKNLVEESFISELKDIYNADFSLNFGNKSENENKSFSLFNLKKPFGEVFSTIPKFLDFKKNDEKFLEDYNEKVFNVI